MSGTAIAIIVIVAAIVVIAIVALALMRARRTQTLRGRFGPEYDRTVSDADSRRRAERDLQQRAARRDELNIRELSPAAASRYQQLWSTVQQNFVDAPIPAVAEAQQLVTSVMRERGYPTADADERESMLSVDHAEVMDEYRRATAIERRSQTGAATTEDLRQAMQHYRTLFERLLGDAATTTTDPAAETYPPGTAGTAGPGTTGTAGVPSTGGRNVVDVTQREGADRRL
jgi:hypothetical protein